MTPLLSRRAALRGGLVVTAGAVAATFAGCDRGPSPEQLAAEELLPLADAALADESAARTLAATAGEYSAALGVVADQRAQHARALREEITRLDQEIAGRIAAPASTNSTRSAPSSSPVAPTGAPAGGSLESLRRALRTSARSAGDIAVTADGYRAGLTGSISASVTTLVEVQLA